MNEWKPVTLGTLIDIKHGHAFPGSGITTEETDDILVTPGNFEVGGGFKVTKFKYFQGDYPEEYALAEGDLIVTMTDLSRDGDTLGYSALVPKIEGKKLLHNQRIGLVSVKADDVSAGFIHWLMRSRRYRFYVLGSATGSTVRHTSPDRIKQIELDIPSDPHEQELIAEILSSLDEKIELNRKQNCTLEAIAQALFKRWFVEFEFPDKNGQPYKSSGGAMQSSELGEIPVGWRVGQFGDIALNKKDSADPSSMDGRTPYVGLEHIGRKCLGLSNWGSAEDVSSNKSRFSAGNILFGKLRPYFHKISIAPFSGICSTDILVLQEVSDKYYCYAVMLVFSEDFVSYSNNASTGTRMPRAAWKHMAEYLLLLPPKELLDRFNALIETIFEKLQTNLSENRTLSGVRDTLLPKLMSGELRVV